MPRQPSDPDQHRPEQDEGSGDYQLAPSDDAPAPPKAKPSTKDLFDEYEPEYEDDYADVDAGLAARPTPKVRQADSRERSGLQSGGSQFGKKEGPKSPAGASAAKSRSGSRSGERPAAKDGKDAGDDEAKARRRRRRKRRKEAAAMAAAEAGTGQRDAVELADESNRSGTGRRRRSRYDEDGNEIAVERRDHDAIDGEPDDEGRIDYGMDFGTWWKPWVDPGAFLWMPVLVPLLSLGSTAALLGYGDPTMSEYVVPFVILSAVFLAAGLATLTTHLSDIVVVWATEDEHDPDWPAFEIGEMAEGLFRWLVVGSATVLIFVPLGWLATVLLAGAGFAVVLTACLAVGLLACLYFSITLLSVLLHDDLGAVLPNFVGQALAKAAAGWMVYLVELTIDYGLLAAGAIFVYQQPGVARQVGYGALWWVVAILLLSRLARALGLTYRRVAPQLRWFRA